MASRVCTRRTADMGQHEDVVMRAKVPDCPPGSTLKTIKARRRHVPEFKRSQQGVFVHQRTARGVHNDRALRATVRKAFCVHQIGRFRRGRAMQRQKIATPSRLSTMS